ncbi:MAG: ferric reductase-like transmembrane domain-containing protein [Terriglobia bacterium]|nr:ferric reductase-like transmembrane domain-containing protein [Terriglobia bacterium]
MFLATANMLLGLLISVRYSPVRFWPHRRFNIFALHNWTGYALLVAVVIHPIILLFVSRNRFRSVDIIAPIYSPLQPFENTLGAVAAYILILVLATSYYRKQIGRMRWKLFHYLVYVSAALVFIHSIFTDPNLNGGAIDYLDGGKVFVFICLAIVTAASLWAWRFRVKKNQHERAAHTGRYAKQELTSPVTWRLDLNPETVVRVGREQGAEPRFRQPSSSASD